MRSHSPARSGFLLLALIATVGAPAAAQFPISIGDLPPGETVTVTFAAQIAGTVTTSSVSNQDTVTDSGSISVLTDDPDAGGAADPTVTPLDVVDLSIAKTDAPDPVLAGNNLVYTVTVTNNGPEDATGVLVTDTLPAGVTFVSTSGCAESPGGGVPTCTLGTITNGSFQQYTITVTVDSSTPAGTLTNNASVTSSKSDTNAANNMTSEDTTVQVETDLAIAKSDDNSNAVAGLNYTYTIAVTNNGPSDSTGSTVTDTLPAGWTFVSSTGSCAGAGVVTCSVGALAAGAMTSFDITAAVPASAAPGLVNNTADVAANETDPTAANDMDTEPTTVVTDADLSITKVDDVDPVIAGDSFTYTVEVVNGGPSDAQNVQVTDTLPALVSLDSTSGCTPEDPNGVPTCTLGTIPAGGSASYTIAVTSDPTAPTTTITNTATVSSSTPDSDGSDNMADETTDLIGDSDLGDAPDPTYPTLIASGGARHLLPSALFLGAAVDIDADGQPTAAADGDDTDLEGDDEDGVVFTSSIVVDTMATVDVTASVAGGRLNAWVDFDQSGGWAHPGEQIFADVVLAAGVNSLSFAVPAGATLGDTYARFRVDSGGGLTPGGLANDGEVEDYRIEIVQEADLAVTLVDTVDPIVAGDVEIYELSTTNNGPGSATGVTLQQELPPGAIFLGAEPSSVDCTLLSSILVECDLGTLVPSATVDLKVGALIDHRIDGTLESEALVSGNEPDPDSANDEAETETEAVRAREMLSTTRGGASTLAAILKEGDSTVAQIFTDPTGGDREYSVEASGFRATSLAEVPSFGGTPSPEVAALAAGFGGETKVIVVDADDQTLLGDYDIVGSWFAMDIVALPSFADTAAPELAIALGSSTELRVQVLDAASGTVVRDHLIAMSLPGPIVAPLPIGMVTVPSFDGTARPELAILTKNPDTEEVRVLVADADSGTVVRDHGQGTDLFPLGIVDLPDLGLGGGTIAADVGILLRRASTDDLFALVLDADNGTPFGPIDFDDTLKPGPMVTVPDFAGSPAPELAVLGREDPADLTLDLKDAATGASLNSIAAGSPPLVPLPLGLASVDSFAGGPSPEIGVLFQFLGDDAQISVFDGMGAAPLFNFFLP